MSEGMLGLLPLREILGPMGDLWTRLASPDGPRVLGALVEWLRNGCKATTIIVRTPFKVWRTVLSGGVPKDELVARVEKTGRRFSDWARGMATKLKPSKKAREYVLVRVKVRDLGFEDSNNLPTTDQVYAAGREQGLDLCPQELPLHVALDYTDQSAGEGVWFAMKQIPDADGDLGVFGLEHDSGRYVDGSFAHPTSAWSLDSGIVFVLRK